MRIKKIALTNFKCFKSAEIELNKLTLLTGPNSSGKSSFTNSLLGVMQSENFPFYYSPNGKYVNMGDFFEMVFNHDINKKFNICLELENKKEKLNIDTSWEIESRSKMPRLYSLQVKGSFLNAEVKKEKNQYVFSFYFDENKYSEIRGEDYIQLRQKIDSIFKDFLVESKRKLTQKGPIINGIVEYEIKSKSIEELYMAIKIDRSTSLKTYEIFAFFKLFENVFNHICSFRLHPERTYYQTTKSDKKIGNFGENTIHQILEWKNYDIKKFRELNQHLRKLGLLYSITPRQLRSGRFELRVKVDYKSKSSSLTDVGFGISQFLPIIVADLQLAKNSTLSIAQPEIHLHPNFQAGYLEYLIDQIKNKSKQYIIETHSEYFINRIRLNIVKGLLKPSEVNLYYFDNSHTGSTYHKIGLSKDGRIIDAPEEFFDTYAIDTMNIAMES